MQEFDLIVVGGGLSGVAAAVAAAREGASVLIVEQYGFLGGAAVHSQVNPFMPFQLKQVDGTKVMLNRGIFERILVRIKEMGGLHENGVTFNEEILKVLLDRMTKENKVKVLFHAVLEQVERRGDEVVSIAVLTKSGPVQLSARYFIDATGDGDLAYLAGCSYQLGREEDQLCQPMTLCFRISNIDMEKFQANRSRITPLYQALQKEGKIRNPREDVLIFSHVSPGVLHFNSTRVVKHNPVDPWETSEAEMTAREQMLELYTFLKENIDGFQDSVLLCSAPQIGVRESRMIHGLYTIQAEDLIGCVKFKDSVARGNYGIDIHSPDGSGTKRQFIKEGEYYTIPYRSLLPRGMSNLIVAGRCISSTHEAQSAYRVMPICCNIGEGAGIAAALALKAGCPVQEVSMDALHRHMEQHQASY